MAVNTKNIMWWTLPKTAIDKTKTGKSSPQKPNFAKLAINAVSTNDWGAPISGEPTGNVAAMWSIKYLNIFIRCISSESVLTITSENS